MIRYVKGDFFDYDTDIRVNTVNCVGVMGAGVALAFKNKYPDMYREYVSVCKNHQIEPGKPHVWHSGDLFSKSLTIINFPTKIHWKNDSKYEYIEKGLQWLQEYLQDKLGASISLPALGCGHGGLDWVIVKKLIEQYLSNVPCDILIFEPSASKAVNESILLNSNIKFQLEKNYISTIDSNSAQYPEKLKKISEKALFTKGNLFNLSKRSIAIISSTKPDEKEKQIIENFLNYLEDKNINLMLGNSGFEKQLIQTISKPITVFLPSGMEMFCTKKSNHDICSRNNILILSIGNPFIDFDKKEYLNSVFARICLADIVLFTTPKLEWIHKYKKKFFDFYGSMFYVNYKELSNDIKQDLHSLSITTINKDSQTLLPKFNLIDSDLN